MHAGRLFKLTGDSGAIPGTQPRSMRGPKHYEYDMTVGKLHAENGSIGGR